MMTSPTEFFRVLTRVGDGARVVSSWVSEADANRIADELQLANPAQRYAVTELVFRRFTEPPAINPDTTEV